jgi:hypothetical protein
LATPFGTLFSTNITPDEGTGIGSWSPAAFRRAMRSGVSRDGKHLYPALPYEHFIHATDADLVACPCSEASFPPESCGGGRQIALREGDNEVSDSRV